jgi:GAF domain-containing protein
MNALLGGVVVAELWQRRKLKRIARRANYEGRPMHAAIRVTNEVRGSIDIARMLETTVVEVARTLEIEHCAIRFDGDNADNRKEGTFACSCRETVHDPVTGAAFKAALNALGDGRADRFLCHGHPNRPDSKNEPNTFPVLGLPINRDGDRLDGALLVLSHNAARVWLESEMQMLLSVAHQLSLSVSHARLFAATEFNSLSDALTGCLNPRGFEMQFETHFRAAQEHKTPISVVMLI